MTRWRVTDRATGDSVAEIDLPHAPGTTPPSSERPLVLPALSPPTARGRTGVEVVLAGWRFEFEIEDAARADLRERASAGRQADAHHGPTDVRAIIPGRVVAVAVEVGDDVQAGQRLLSVEAMKMENELRAPRGGVVERLAVAVGQTVELGDTLVVIR